MGMNKIASRQRWSVKVNLPDNATAIAACVRKSKRRGIVRVGDAMALAGSREGNAFFVMPAVFRNNLRNELLSGRRAAVAHYCRMLLPIRPRFAKRKKIYIQICCANNLGFHSKYTDSR